MKNEIQTPWENSDPLGAIVQVHCSQIKYSGLREFIPYSANAALRSSIIRVVRVLSYTTFEQENFRTELVQTFTEPGPVNGWLTRARPPVAFVRIRACWYASAAMSETNFCAARDNSRFLWFQGEEEELNVGEWLTIVYHHTQSQRVVDSSQLLHSESSNHN